MVPTIVIEAHSPQSWPMKIVAVDIVLGAVRGELRRLCSNGIGEGKSHESSERSDYGTHHELLPQGCHGVERCTSRCRCPRLRLGAVTLRLSILARVRAVQGRTALVTGAGLRATATGTLDAVLPSSAATARITAFQWGQCVRADEFFLRRESNRAPCIRTTPLSVRGHGRPGQPRHGYTHV